MSKANQYLASNGNASPMSKNEEAVSPVIGVILMVAITVILAAVIAAFVFGFAGQMPKAPNTAYFQVERSAPDAITITPTNPTIADVTLLQVSIGAAALTQTDLDALMGGAAVTWTDATPATPEDIVISGSVNGLPVQVLQEITL